MIRRNTWIILALFLAFLAAALWYSQQSQPSAPELEPTVEPLWFIPEADIEAISIEDVQSGTTLRAQRQPEIGWTLLEPEPASEAQLTDVARIERAVSALQLISPIDRFAAEDLSQYGLDQPVYQIVISLTDDSNRGLLVGRQAPTGDVYYVKQGGTGEVLLLDTSSIQSVIDLMSSPPLVTATPELTATAPEG